MEKFGKKQAETLLAEHAQLKGSEDIGNWNLRAQTLLVFVAMNRICNCEWRLGEEI